MKSREILDPLCSRRVVVVGGRLWVQVAARVLLRCRGVGRVSAGSVVGVREGVGIMRREIGYRFG